LSGKAGEKGTYLLPEREGGNEKGTGGTWASAEKIKGKEGEAHSSKIAGKKWETAMKKRNVPRRGWTDFW